MTDTPIADVVKVVTQYERRGYPGDPAAIFRVRHPDSTGAFAAIKVHVERDRTHSSSGTLTYAVSRWLPNSNHGWAHIVTVDDSDVIDVEDAARLGFEITEGIAR